MRETFKRAAVLSILLMAGCAYTPIDVSELQLTARDGGMVYYAALRRDSPAVITITGEIDRRVYAGKLELTDANATFGLYQLYGPRDAVAGHCGHSRPHEFHEGDPVVERPPPPDLRLYGLWRQKRGGSVRRRYETRLRRHLHRPATAYSGLMPAALTTLPQRASSLLR